jgi:hypothetical protein
MTAMLISGERCGRKPLSGPLALDLFSRNKESVLPSGFILRGHIEDRSLSADVARLSEIPAFLTISSFCFLSCLKSLFVT